MKMSERKILTFVLLAFACALLGLSTRLGPVARLVPAAVAVPTLALLILQLAFDLSPVFEKKYRKFDGMDLLGIDPVRRQAPEPGRGTNAAVCGLQELILIAWIALLLLLVYLIGPLWAIPLFTLLYLRFRAEERWLLSMLVAIGTWTLCWPILSLGLGIHSGQGRLWFWMGL